jgi:hypothetical protein
MPTNKHRIAVPLEDDMNAILTQLNEMTGIPIAGLIRTALVSKRQDFLDFIDYINALPPVGRQRFDAVATLQAPGPSTLKDDLEQLSRRYSHKNGG